MSKQGLFVDRAPTGLGAHLRQCATAVSPSPVPVLAALDINIAETVREASPTTQIIFRTQINGADNGMMYTGDLAAAHLAGHDWVAHNADIWRLNPANFYAPINEPGRSDVFGIQWICAFLMGCMDEGQDRGFPIALANWSTGMPPISAAESARQVERLTARRHLLASQYKQGDGEALFARLDARIEQHTIVAQSPDADYISIYLPMLRQAKVNGHILALHEYANTPKMLDDPDVLRYKQFYALLPDSAQPQIVIAEASPDVAFPCSGVEYVAKIAPYDAALMQDNRVIGACLFKLGGGESNLASILSDLTAYVIAHPTPTAPPVDDRIETLEDDFMRLGARVDDLAKEVADVRAADQDDHIVLLGMTDQANQSIAALVARVAQLEGTTPLPPPPPPHDVIFGLHCRADGGDLPRVEYDTLGAIHGRVTGYKFLTGCSVSHYSAVLEGQHYTPSLCMTRLFWDARGETVRPSPARFVELMRAGINDAWHFGVRCFELLNEPNLYSEWHANWGGPVGFVDWAIQVISLLRSEWPSIRIITPGLAPRPDEVGIGEDADRWITAFKDGELFNACDFAGVHAYWRTRATMLTVDDGLNFHRYFSATNKPIWITEFANNKANDPDADKGAQYREYVDYLRANEPRVDRAYAYAMSSGSRPDNDTRQTWIRGGAVTDIARAVAG